MKDPEKDPEKKKKIKIERKDGDPYFRDEKSFTKYYADKAAQKLAKDGKFTKMTDDPSANRDINIATKADIPSYTSFTEKEKTAKTESGDNVVRSKLKTGYNSDGESPKKAKKKSLTSRLKSKYK